MPASIKKDIRKRFYSAVVFLSAVTGVYKGNRQPVSHDTTRYVEASAESQFRDYVNRLSQFCDVKAGGDCVTAFTVLDLQDRVQYRFAANKRNKGQLTRTATFVSDLLETLQHNASEPDVDLIILEKVLGHCRIRVHFYLGKFIKACRACVNTGDGDKKLLEDVFEKAAREADFGRLPEPDFARLCKKLMGLIELSLKQPDDTIFAERGFQSSMGESSSCWVELRHFAGRLLSFYTGTRTLIAVAKTCPRLVENIEVKFVRSSVPDENPFQDQDTTAEKIMSAVVTDAQQKVYYQALIQEARSLDLENRVQAVINEDRFKPLVHAELLVLQSLEKDELTHPSHFFGGWRYIGSSKQTCRLCNWYFQVHDGGFAARPTHGNLYLNWKPPDVFQQDGEAAIRARESMLKAMVQPIRSEALRTLKDKMPLGKQFDSTTGMTIAAGAVMRENLVADRAGVDEDLDTAFDDSEVLVQE